MGFSRHGNLENNQMIGNWQAGIAVENGIKYEVRNNVFLNNRHGILLWSKHVPEIERSVPKNTTSLDWRIEHNTFTGNYTAIRIAANQDHRIRPISVDGELGFTARKPANHIICNNKFHENLPTIDQVDIIYNTINQNELIKNLYE
jgi:parallel beta-helix repeat protein